LKATSKRELQFMKYVLTLFTGTLILGGCTSSGVVPMDKGTYLITRRSAQIGTGTPVGTKAKVYSEANEFCARNGMTVETVNLQVNTTLVANPGSVELQFRCVPK
jgi:hypothetical protein